MVGHVLIDGKICNDNFITGPYWTDHCLIVSENLVYATMNRNFPII